MTYRMTSARTQGDGQMETNRQEAHLKVTSAYWVPMKDNSFLKDIAF